MIVKDLKEMIDGESDLVEVHLTKVSDNKFILKVGSTSWGYLNLE